MQKWQFVLRMKATIQIQQVEKKKSLCAKKSLNFLHKKKKKKKRKKYCATLAFLFWAIWFVMWSRIHHFF